MSTLTKENFKDFLEEFSNLFSNKEYNSETASELRQKIDLIDRNQIIEEWVGLLKNQGPVEKISENKYEIYDVNNFLGESNDSSGNYIHTIEFNEFETSSSIFMKFFFVFYCLINSIKSNEYKIDYVQGGWM